MFHSYFQYFSKNVINFFRGWKSLDFSRNILQCPQTIKLALHTSLQRFKMNSYWTYNFKRENVQKGQAARLDTTCAQTSSRRERLLLSQGYRRWYQGHWWSWRRRRSKDQTQVVKRRLLQKSNPQNSRIYFDDGDGAGVRENASLSRSTALHQVWPPHTAPKNTHT